MENNRISHNIGLFPHLIPPYPILVYQRRRQEERKNGGCTSKKQTDPAFDCVVPALPTQPVVRGGVLIPDSPQCGNNEKANLISN